MFDVPRSIRQEWWFLSRTAARWWMSRNWFGILDKNLDKHWNGDRQLEIDDGFLWLPPFEWCQERAVCWFTSRNCLWSIRVQNRQSYQCAMRLMKRRVTTHDIIKHTASAPSERSSEKFNSFCIPLYSLPRTFLIHFRN